MKAKEITGKVNFFLTIIIFLFGFLPENHAQDSLNCYLKGIWAEGICEAVDVNDNYIFINNGRYLDILDNTDPGNPAKISRYISRGFIYDIKSRDTLVFLAINGTGLQIISIANISNPVEISYIKIAGYYPYIEIQGDRLFYSENKYYLHIIDISNPAHPEIIAEHKLPSIKKFKVRGNYVFATLQWYGFKILDISTPGSINEVFYYDTKNCYDVAIKDNLMSLSLNNKLLIFDISNISSPVLLDTINLISGFYNCTFYDKNTIIIAGNKDIIFVDIRDINNPVISTGYEIDVLDFEKMLIHNDFLYLALHQNGLNILDISNMDNVYLKGKYDTGKYANSIALKDSIVYLTQYPDKISVLNVSDPQKPVVVQTIEGLKIINFIRIKDNYLFCSDMGLRIFDISNPLNPQEISYYENNSWSYDFIIRDTLVYLATGSNGIVIIDISDINHPQKIWALDKYKKVKVLDVRESLAIFSNFPTGLIIVDISDPSNPVELFAGKVGNRNDFHSIKIFRHYVVLGSRNWGGMLADISDPSAPRYIKNLPKTHRGLKFQIKDEFLYVAGGYVGLRIIDLSDPEHLRVKGKYNTPGKVYDLAIKDSLVYLADYEDGMVIVDFDTIYHCPQLTISANKQDVTCFGACDGKIAIQNVQNAFNPVRYHWDNGMTGKQISGLCTGTYIVTITDKKDCTVVDTFQIDSPPELVIGNIQKTDIDDEHNRGSISLAVSGGTPPYSYSWSGPGGFSSTSKDITGLNAGCYSLTVTDANECTVTPDSICIEDNTSGIEETIDKMPLIIYPNPSGGKIKIIWNDDTGCGNDKIHLTIFTITGRRVLDKFIKQNMPVVINFLHEGLYTARIKAGNRILNKKIIVLR